MARTKNDDLSINKDLTEEETKKVKGGALRKQSTSNISEANIPIPVSDTKNTDKLGGDDLGW